MDLALADVEVDPLERLDARVLLDEPADLEHRGEGLGGHPTTSGRRLRWAISRPGFDLLRAAAPDRVLVLHREHAVESALVERVDVVAEVDLAEARDPVAPPAHVPRVLRRGSRAAEEPVAVALGREGLGVLGVRVDDPVDVRPQRGDRVDAEPEQVGRVEVEIEAELEHPLPELGRVGEVARVAVRVPALHHAVLDHQPHAALAGVVDERREDALGLAQVLRDAAAGSRPMNVPTGRRRARPPRRCRRAGGRGPPRARPGSGCRLLS